MLDKKGPKRTVPFGPLWPPLAPSAVLNFEIVAGEHPSVFAAQMHCAALAVAPNLAAGTFILFHPAAVTVYLETAVPYLPEIIGMHVALVIIAAHA